MGQPPERGGRVIARFNEGSIQVIPDRRQVFQRLTAGIVRSLFSTAVYLLGNSEDAQHLTRDAILRGFERFRSTARCGPFRVWMFSILFEVYRDQARSSVEPPAFLAVYDASHPDSDPALFSHTSRGIADSGPIAAALAGMPTDSRALFLLCDVEGFNYAQAAQILAIRPDQVAERLCEARWQLRSRIATSPARRPPIGR